MSPSSQLTKDVLSYTAQRVTFASPKPFKDVIAALDKELNASGAGIAVMQMLATAQSREEIEKGMNEMTDNGKRDFVYVSILSPYSTILESLRPLLHALMTTLPTLTGCSPEGLTRGGSEFTLRERERSLRPRFSPLEIRSLPRRCCNMI